MWTGLDELGLLLRGLGDAVQVEAGQVVAAAAREHHALVTSRFPEKDGPGRRGRPGGNLRRGNTLVQTGELTWRTRNRAPHSHLYEKGFSHVSGTQVAGHDVWVPGAQEIRDRMLERMRQIVTREATRTGALTGQA